MKCLGAMCAVILVLAATSLSSEARLPPTENDITFIVFFENDSTDLDNQALGTLKFVDATMKDSQWMGPVLVTGHSSPDEEKVVSLDRALAVAKKLREMGVPGLNKMFVGA